MSPALRCLSTVTDVDSVTRRALRSDSLSDSCAFGKQSEFMSIAVSLLKSCVKPEVRGFFCFFLKLSGCELELPLSFPQLSVQCVIRDLRVTQ